MKRERDKKKRRQSYELNVSCIWKEPKEKAKQLNERLKIKSLYI